MRTDEVVTEDNMMAETKSSACKPSVEERGDVPRVKAAPDVTAEDGCG